MTWPLLATWKSAGHPIKERAPGPQCLQRVLALERLPKGPWLPRGPWPRGLRRPTVPRGAMAASAIRIRGPRAFPAKGTKQESHQIQARTQKWWMPLQSETVKYWPSCKIWIIISKYFKQPRTQLLSCFYLSTASQGHEIPPPPAPVKIGFLAFLGTDCKCAGNSQEILPCTPGSPEALELQQSWNQSHGWQLRGCCCMLVYVSVRML